MVNFKTDQGVWKYGIPRIKSIAPQDEMPYEDHMIMEGEDIIEVEYCMSKLVDLALG